MSGKGPRVRALGVARATFYRRMDHGENPDVQNTRPDPPPSLTQTERQNVVDILNSEKYQDKAPSEVYARLWDEGEYHCSIRTMYRLLKAENGDVKERRRGDLRNHYHKPVPLATAPNQVWSWDITKLKRPVKWSYFYLHVILDIFSRYVVGWLVSHREQDALAKRLIEDKPSNRGSFRSH